MSAENKDVNIENGHCETDHLSLKTT